jgi:hypothetical protein
MVTYNLHAFDVARPFFSSSLLFSLTSPPAWESRPQPAQLREVLY